MGAEGNEQKRAEGNEQKKTDHVWREGHADTKWCEGVL